MDASTWNSMFTELPSKQVKVGVKDKRLLQCTEDETRLVQPSALQQEIDEIVSTLAPAHGRCFVRPSGTEDVVRIYAEASTVEEVDGIIDAVRTAISRHC